MRLVVVSCLLSVSLAGLAVARVAGPSAPSRAELVLPSATALVVAESTGLAVRWSPVAGARSYRVFRSTRIPVPSLVATLPGGQTRFEDRGLAPGTGYAYRVVAYPDPDGPSAPIGAFMGQGTTADAWAPGTGPGTR